MSDRKRRNNMEEWKKKLKEKCAGIVDSEILNAVFELAAVLDKNNVPKDGRCLTYYDKVRDKSVTIKM